MNLKDCVNIVHSIHPCNFQYTLCGLAYDAPLDRENDTCSDNIMINTDECINCPECIKIIQYCKKLKKRTIHKL